MASTAAVHQTLDAIERAIDAAERERPVTGRCYARPFDAARQRRASAERQLRQTLRTLVHQRVITEAHAERSAEVAALYAAGETRCVWCENPFTAADAIVPAGGGRLMHESPCSEEYDALAGGLRTATVDGATLQPYAITFRTPAGYVATWTRFAGSLDEAEADARAALGREYPDGRGGTGAMLKQIAPCAVEG